jgi:endonuclease/exonuclease/phosphatase family metal-dependent hydrolase
MKLKIMQYNILAGFRKFEKPYTLEENRLKSAQKIVEKEDPDILALNEAYFESENKSAILMDYQKIFDFPFYAHGNHENKMNFFWGNCILSKHPIIFEENLSKKGKSLLRLKIKIENKIIDLDVTHLSMIPLTNSKGQGKLTKEILKGKKSNYLLIGDLNSLSPLDKYNKKKMINSWSKFSKGILDMPHKDRKISTTKDLVEEMLKRDAVKEVSKKGLVDTYKKKNKNFDFTIPTDLLSKDKSSGVRMDYIFCSKDFKVLKSGIIKNKLTEMASDHYPIYAVLELK